MSTISQRPAPDYPQMAAVRGRVEPAPRRVRGFLGHQLVFDTTSARYVWEVPYYPQYYIPRADVVSKTNWCPRKPRTRRGAGSTRPRTAAIWG